MRRIAGVLLVVTAGCVSTPPAATVPSEVGDRAAGFSLASTGATESLSLDELRRDGPVVLIFYRGEWCIICDAQLKRFEELRKEFETIGVRLAAISVDTIEVSRKYAAKQKFGFPLLSDENGEIIRTYGVLHQGHKFAAPAIFIVDRDGVIRWKRISASILDRPDEGLVLGVARDLLRR